MPQVSSVFAKIKNVTFPILSIKTGIFPSMNSLKLGALFSRSLTEASVQTITLHCFDLRLLKNR